MESEAGKREMGVERSFVVLRGGAPTVEEAASNLEDVINENWEQGDVFVPVGVMSAIQEGEVWHMVMVGWMYKGGRWEG